MMLVLTLRGKRDFWDFPRFSRFFSDIFIRAIISNFASFWRFFSSWFCITIFIKINALSSLDGWNLRNYSIFSYHIPLWHFLRINISFKYLINFVQVYFIIFLPYFRYCTRLEYTKNLQDYKRICKGVFMWDGLAWVGSPNRSIFHPGFI